MTMSLWAGTSLEATTELVEVTAFDANDANTSVLTMSLIAGNLIHDRDIDGLAYV